MPKKWSSFAGVFMLLEENWCDVTEDSPEGSPFTLAKSKDGIGALQFSVAFYSQGRLPALNNAKLRDLLFSFFKSKNFGEPFDLASWRNEIYGVSGDCRLDREYFRIWYVSDGKNVALVTYTCLQTEDPNLKSEVSEADEIVRSIRFDQEEIAEEKDS